MSYREYLQTRHWHELRSHALWLAGYRCAICGRLATETELHVHHKHYDSLGEERPEDLTVLCSRCHAIFEEAQIIGAR